jgi:hypothetical protein
VTPRQHCRPQYIGKRCRDRRQQGGSNGLSLPSSCKGSGNLSLTCKLASISLADTLLYMPDLPLMNFKISIDRFIQEVAPIPIESDRDGIELFFLIRLEPEADCFTIHR